MKTKALVVTFILAVILVSCAPRKHFVVYSASSDEKSVNLYLVDTDSVENQQLTNVKYANYPAWSPDGKKIVFTSDGGLYFMSINKADRTRIIDTPKFEIHPIWSPDGSKIAFISQDIANQLLYDLMVVNVDGTELVTLARNLGEIDYFSSFSWSPDSKKITFSNPVNESREIFTVNADGTDLTQVTHLSLPYAPPVQPAWSPDGKKIAFVTWKLLIMNSDGTNLIEWDTKGYPRYPKWSRDGKFIACRRSENVILVDPINGQITTVDEESPIADYSWSLQGDELGYFVIGDTLNIEKININSMQKAQLTKDVGFYPWQSLAWQP
jgi:Tol biopolymer transport system component